MEVMLKIKVNLNPGGRKKKITEPGNQIYFKILNRQGDFLNIFRVKRTVCNVDDIFRGPVQCREMCTRRKQHQILTGNYSTNCQLPYNIHSISY